MNSKEVCPHCERPLYPLTQLTKGKDKITVTIQRATLDDIADTLQNISEGLKVLAWDL